MAYTPAINFLSKLREKGYEERNGEVIAPAGASLSTAASTFDREFWTEISRCSWQLPPGASHTYDEEASLTDTPEVKEKIRSELIASLGQGVLDALEKNYKQSMINEAIFLVDSSATLPPLGAQSFVSVSKADNGKKLILDKNQDGTYALTTRCALSYTVLEPNFGTAIIPGVITQHFTVNPTEQTMRFDGIQTSNAVLTTLISGAAVDLTETARIESMQKATQEERQNKAKAELAEMLKPISPINPLQKVVDALESKKPLTEIIAVANEIHIKLKQTLALTKGVNTSAILSDDIMPVLAQLAQNCSIHNRSTLKAQLTLKSNGGADVSQAVTDILSSLSTRVDLSNILPRPADIMKLTGTDEENKAQREQLIKQLTLYIQDLQHRHPEKDFEKILLHDIVKSAITASADSGQVYDQAYFKTLHERLEQSKAVVSTADQSSLKQFQKAAQYVIIPTPADRLESQIESRKASKAMEALRKELIRELEKTLGMHTQWGGYARQKTTDNYPKNAARMLNILDQGGPNFLEKLSAFTRTIQLDSKSVTGSLFSTRSRAVDQVYQTVKNKVSTGEVYFAGSQAKIQALQAAEELAEKARLHKALQATELAETATTSRQSDSDAGLYRNSCSFAGSRRGSIADLSQNRFNSAAPGRTD